ncbi:MAG TPA: alpha/beta fold hydrolase [Candidatus Chromulinivoraceae bacterium]|nr:alpha/beta fold hydrolase [Candidatus Chromulinivoraceae bacterium]
MNTDITAVPLKIVTALRDEKFELVESLFAPPLRAVASADSIRAAWAAEINKSGAVVSIGETISENIEQGLLRVSVPLVQERGELTIIMSVDDKGMLQGLRFAPATSVEWTPPTYVKPSKFTEEEVAIEAKSMAVKGTLSLPNGEGPYPAVVLLSGGGPFDRDETYGPNKPLKDIAWGLATQGIATLRFDKVTFTDSEIANSNGFTMSEEYVPHAIAAIHILQKHPIVDPTRIFVLGHSMGGKVAPRVATVEPSIAGLIILAGDTQPMQHAAVRVARYLAEIEPTAANKKAIEIISHQVQAVDDPNLSLLTESNALPFGFPASYWLDMRSYDPVVVASALDKPMFIAQGGRDYQVTVEDDFSRWKTELDRRHDITFRVYAADNHLFFPGKARSTPAEYDLPQHVDASLVKDIAHWVKPAKGIAAWLRSHS